MTESIEWAGPYEFSDAPPCARGPQIGTSALAAAILTNWPVAGSDGIFNCRPPSLHSDGRAFDCHLDLVGGHPNIAVGDEILRTVAAHAVPLGVQLIIWNRRIYSASHAWPEGDAYVGDNPHDTHLHIEQVWDKAAGVNYLRFDAALELLRSGQHGEGGGDPLQPPEGDDMPTLQEIRELMAGPPARQIRVRRADGTFEDEFYAWVAGVLRHVWTRDTQNGMQAIGALAPEVDECIDSQISNAIQQGRDWGTHVRCGCGRPTCRVNVD